MDVFSVELSVTAGTGMEVVSVRATGDTLDFVVTGGRMEVVNASGDSKGGVVVVSCGVGILEDQDVLSVECLEVKGGTMVVSVVLNAGATAVVVTDAGPCDAVDTSVVTFSVVALTEDSGGIGPASVVVVSGM